MRISQYPEHLKELGFKKRVFSDRSGSWYDKKISDKGIGYSIEVDLDVKLITVSLCHKVKNGPHLFDELKSWKLTLENLNKVLEEWDQNWYR